MEPTTYVVIINCFSRYFETIKLKSTTSSSIIEVLKSVFSMYGIPETVISDNGPQYSSYEFGNFASSHKFAMSQAVCSSLRVNGQVERTVQTAKRLLKNAKDPYMALLTYHTTPLTWCNFMPAQLLMGRCLQTTLAQVDERLQPQWKYLEMFRILNKQFKEKQKISFDCRH